LAQPTTPIVFFGLLILLGLAVFLATRNLSRNFFLISFIGILFSLAWYAPLCTDYQTKKLSLKSTYSATALTTPNEILGFISRLFSPEGAQQLEPTKSVTTYFLPRITII